jgi:hypothetical protein
MVMAVLGGLCGWAAPVRADLINSASWTFATASNSPVVSAADGSGAAVLLQGGSGFKFGTGEILGARMFTFDSSTTPSSVGPTDFTETVFIRDSASGETGSATFDFTLSGTVTSQRSYLSIVPDGPTSQRLHLGHYFYDISPDSFQAPPHAGYVDGRLLFHVKVQHNPEPATLILAGLGLPAALLFRRRRRLAAR